MTRSGPEQALQRAIAHYLHVVLPGADAPYWTAINPVPAKSRAAAGISKAMGLRAGCPDLMMVWRGRPIFFELKAPKGVTSDAQDEAFERLTLHGAACFVIRSVDEMRGALKVLGIQTRECAA